jgi:glycosyltransferase involved in cell wall biosynthesis
MKIAIMMRGIDQDSGLRVYVERIVDAMLKIDPENYYVLLYRTRKWFGRFSSFKNTKEILLRAPHKLAWDQITVPYIAWKEHADIIFNPKFSVPLVSPCPVAMSLREPAWWSWSEDYPMLNAYFMRATVPLYCRKSAALFPISTFVLDENRKYLKVPDDKITVAYPAPNEHFRPINDSALFNDYREKYRLPKRFILNVTRVDHPGIENCTSFFPGKNVETSVRAFARCRQHIPHKLVIAGRRVREYVMQKGFTNEDLQGVHFTGFVPHEEIFVLYNLAELFILPTFYESYAQTLVEAMSCGCPAVVSQTGACPEISGGAALFADPTDPADFAKKIMLILNNEELRQELRAKGLQRTAFFSWERTARTILEGLTRAVEKSR